MIYNDVEKEKYIYRTFEPDSIQDSDLVWHRDKRDRKVLVVAGDNWQLQFDDQLPIELTVDDLVVIKANFYHRLIKKENSNKLILRIEEV